VPVKGLFTCHRRPWRNLPNKKNSVSWSARRKWNEAELCTLTMEGQPQNFALPGFSMGCGSLEDLDGWQVTVDLSCNWRIGSDRVEAHWGHWVGGHSKVWTWGDSVTDQGVTVNRPAQQAWNFKFPLPVKGKIYKVHNPEIFSLALRYYEFITNNK